MRRVCACACECWLAECARGWCARTLFLISRLGDASAYAVSVCVRVRMSLQALAGSVRAVGAARTHLTRVARPPHTYIQVLSVVCRTSDEFVGHPTKALVCCCQGFKK